MTATPQSSPKNDQQNLGNAYYLHPGESPAMAFVTLHLDRSNYHSWSRAMKCTLLSKNKLNLSMGRYYEVIVNTKCGRGATLS